MGPAIIFAGMSKHRIASPGAQSPSILRGGDGQLGSKAFGQVMVTRSIGMPDGSRINVVRKDVMDHALGRVSSDRKK